jgi:adenylylsulfate kinase-like enzyme
LAARRIATGVFLEVHVDCPMTELRRRDTKGLYARADRGLEPQLTGVTAVYEAPASPDIHLDTQRQSVIECVETIMDRMTVG